jgi:hypothetical protein
MARESEALARWKDARRSDSVANRAELNRKYQLARDRRRGRG